MEDFKTAFNRRRQCDFPMGMIVRYNNSARIKGMRAIFVEGSTDKYFYSATRIQSLAEGAEYYYSIKSDQQEYSTKLVGKEAVLRCYYYLNHRNEFASDIKNCIFIVDRDYDPDLKLVKTNISEEDKQFICITSGYSFENYYYSNDNLTMLFKKVGLSKEDVINFKKSFSKFIEVILGYCAATIVITQTHGNTREPYKSTYKDEDIFCKSIKESNGIDRKKLSHECKNRMSFVEDNPFLKVQYDTIYNSLKRDPGNNIKGHIVYDYLVKYLCEIHGITYSLYEEKCRRTIREFDIDIKGLGEKRQ